MEKYRGGNLRPPGVLRVAFHWLHGVFNSMWKTIATNMEKYKSYPRIVGERAARTTCWQTRPPCPKEVATALHAWRI